MTHIIEVTRIDTNLYQVQVNDNRPHTFDLETVLRIRSYYEQTTVSMIYVNCYIP